MGVCADGPLPVYEPPPAMWPSLGLQTVERPPAPKANEPVASAIAKTPQMPSFKAPPPEAGRPPNLAERMEQQAAWFAGGNGEIPFALIWGCYRKAFFGPVTLIFELGFGILAFKSSNRRNKSGQTELKKPKFIFSNLLLFWIARKN